MRLAFEPLGKHHDRASFASGRAELDAWFRTRARQDEQRDVARVFVAVDAALGVVGFYSLSSFSIALPDLPTEVASKLPRYDAIPAALIGRLARDQRVRGCGVGGLLLADAVHRILAASRSIAIFAIVVDAIDTPAADFYQAFGFTPFPSRPMRLFLPAATARDALERSLRP